jgi:hypothetical protein
MVVPIEADSLIKGHRYMTVPAPGFGPLHGPVLGKFVRIDGDNAIFEDTTVPQGAKTPLHSFSTRRWRFLALIGDTIKNKAGDQMVRDFYEKNTGLDGGPGTGPADLIRGYLGIKVPKHAAGRTRRRRPRKTRRSRK